MVKYTISKLHGKKSYTASNGHVYEYGEIQLTDGKNSEIYQIPASKYSGLEEGGFILFDENDVVRKVYKSQAGNWFNAAPKLRSFVPFRPADKALVGGDVEDDEDVDSDDEDSEPIID